MKIGIAVECTTCGMRKAPRGRSVPDALLGGLCHDDYSRMTCPGYWDDPKPGDLWPGETAEDFGYPCSDNATEEAT